MATNEYLWGQWEYPHAQVRCGKAWSPCHCWYRLSQRPVRPWCLRYRLFRRRARLRNRPLYPRIYQIKRRPRTLHWWRWCSPAICGGFQLLGQYYIEASGKRIEGLGIMGHYTLNKSTTAISVISKSITKNLTKPIMVLKPPRSDLLGWGWKTAG